MIHVAGEINCGSADVEIDPWIPLKVSWWPRGQVQPLYLRVSGVDGGEVELKVDPFTGALLQVIIIDEPPTLTIDPRGSAKVSEEFNDKTPRIDRALWQLSGDDQDGFDTLPVFIEVRDLAIYRDDRVVVLLFSDAPVAMRLQCQGVAVGITADGNLATVEAATPS